MYFIHNQSETTIQFGKDDFADTLVDNDSIEDLLSLINSKLAVLLNFNSNNEYNKQLISFFNNDENSAYETLRRGMFKKTELLRKEILPKYLAGNNLNLFMSNGCSICADAKAINNEQATSCTTLLQSFCFSDNAYPELINTINNLVEKRPEVALDNLCQISSYLSGIVQSEKHSLEVDTLISSFKNAFLEECVLTIDYSKIDSHKQFFKRVLSRDSKLEPIKVFTPNYDLLIERSCESLGIHLNSGFIGFHDRYFDPSSYKMGVHIRGTQSEKRTDRSLNLYKIHGSLSWEINSQKPPYGISETQLELKDGRIPSSSIGNEVLIYPVQTKKRQALDLPYSELLRQFVEALSAREASLIVIGYSFLDEHINDIISSALANPDFSLVVFTYPDKQQTNSPFLKSLFERAIEDKRISIFSGDVLGNFEHLTRYILPYADHQEPLETFFNTFQKLQKTLSRD